MIRPFTAMCALLAGASGLYLYSEKHQTTVLDQQISKIVQDTQHVRERTGMLRAEWALLNQPDRLQSLATRFLPDLEPMQPVQFVQMASLVDHLPEIQKPVPPIAMAMNRPMLAPEQVMARSLVAAPGTTITQPSLASDEPAASDLPESSDPEPSGAEAAPVPDTLGSKTLGSETLAHASARLPASRRHEPVHAIRLVGARRPLATTASAFSQAAHQPSQPERRLVSWQTLRRQPALPADAEPVSQTGSALGFAHASLAAPVPVREAD